MVCIFSGTMPFAQQRNDVYMPVVDSFEYSSGDVHKLLWDEELVEYLWDARSELFIEAYLIESMDGLAAPISASMAVKLFAALNNPAVSKELFNLCIDALRLKFDSQSDIIKLAASKKHLISESVLRLAYDGFPELSDFVATCPNTPFGIFEELLYDKEPPLESLALNTNLPESVRDEIIRISFELIQKRTYTKFYNVMVRLAQFSILTELQVERIFECQDARVCTPLLSQPYLPQKIVEALSGHQQGLWFESRDCFIDNDFILLDHFRLEWLKSGYLTYEQQMKFVTGDKSHQIALASNNNLCIDAIKILGKSTSIDVQQAICKNVIFRKYDEELSRFIAESVDSICLLDLLRNDSFQDPIAWLTIYDRFFDEMHTHELAYCLRGINSSLVISTTINSKSPDALLELSYNPWLNATQITLLLQALDDLHFSCESSLLISIVRNISNNPNHNITSIGKLISFYAEIKCHLNVETNVSKDIFNASVSLLRKVICPSYFGLLNESCEDKRSFFCELNHLIHLILDHTSDDLLISKSPFYHIVVTLVERENIFFGADAKGLGILCKIQQICPSVGEKLLNRALTFRQGQLTQDGPVTKIKNRRQL